MKTEIMTPMESKGRIANLEAVLRQLVDPVCEYLCPAVWRTGEEQTHSDECIAIKIALQESSG